jgi:hypothetical protein
MTCVPLRSIHLHFKHFYAANINEYRAKQFPTVSNINNLTPLHYKSASGTETAQSVQCLNYGLNNQGILVEILAGSRDLFLVQSIQIH